MHRKPVPGYQNPFDHPGMRRNGNERRLQIIMNITEVARLLLGLRAAGWSEKEINDFVLYIESGEEQYKPKPRGGCPD